MNPFDIAGPAFLAFYSFVAVALLGFLYLVKMGVLSGPQREVTSDAGNLLQDPYAVAFMRAGHQGAGQALVFTLLYRGALRSDGARLTAVAAPAPTLTHPLEKLLIAKCAQPKALSDLWRDEEFADAIFAHEHRLRVSRLMADEVETLRTRTTYDWVIYTLLAVGLVKMGLSWHRGDTSLLMLAGCTLTALLFAAYIFESPQTNAGKAALADLQFSMRHLRARMESPSQGVAAGDAAMVVAVFGLSALSPDSHPAIGITLHHESLDAM